MARYDGYEYLLKRLEKFYQLALIHVERIS